LAPSLDRSRNAIPKDRRLSTARAQGDRRSSDAPICVAAWVNHGALQPTTLLAFYGSGRMFTMLKRRRD
jgi:hypothetical protein